MATTELVASLETCAPAERFKKECAWRVCVCVSMCRQRTHRRAVYIYVKTTQSMRLKVKNPNAVVSLKFPQCFLRH